MPLDPKAIAPAIAKQQAAASDGAGEVRLVAGPGSGKSFSIEARVEHLLRQSLQPLSILAVSFTRNSARDLADRIAAHCTAVGLPQGADVRVSTLHSVALRVMRLANLLNQYPVDPRVLDEWEMRHWIDAEFADDASCSPGRAKDVREFHEALWSTGQQNPANYIPATPPISQVEQQQFNTFHRDQTTFYACLLVGEIVQACMNYASPGAIDLRLLLGIDHLIVDEYQDLNPMDLRFVDHLVGQGVATFVAGDDDQSVYSFRHASPQGIQTFNQRFPQAADHMLSDCFRCTPSVLSAALSVLTYFAAPSRIPKQLNSLYATANPPVNGLATMTLFASPQAEVSAIADSCNELHVAGLNWGDLMILLGNRRVMASEIENALSAKGVPFAPIQSEPFSDTDAGRTGYSLLRILADGDDLVAHRNLLGLLSQMGPARCRDVTRRCIAANMNAVGLYRGHIPNGVLQPMQLTKVNQVRSLVAAVRSWDLGDTIAQRGADLSQLVSQVRGPADQQSWDAYCQALPPDATLQELLSLLQAGGLEKSNAVISTVHERLGLDAPPATDGDLVEVMTMHGSKGLSAKVVFIPGLEENVFPTQRMQQAPGLISEGARLMYVSITRARAAVICSAAYSRNQNGQRVQNNVSRFAVQLNLQIPYQGQPQGLTPQEAQQIAATCAQL
ncbi:MAG: ATP-dependent helicase [Acidimicrobiia bacterium]|nr:ATP-dependent helicase [Acidimicrobiia bacterium]